MHPEGYKNKKEATDERQPLEIFGDPRGIRTPVTGVRGRRPNH